MVIIRIDKYYRFVIKNIKTKKYYTRYNGWSKNIENAKLFHISQNLEELELNKNEKVIKIMCEEIDKITEVK